MKKMTQMIALLLALCLMAGCGMGEEPPAPTEPEVTGPAMVDMELDVGIHLSLPAAYMMSVKESQYNDFFAMGTNGEWALIINLDEKANIASLEECATLLAQNYGVTAEGPTGNGNYTVSYASESDGCHYYTLVCEGPDAYYRVAFYCPEEFWQTYEGLFAQWGESVSIPEPEVPEGDVTIDLGVGVSLVLPASCGFALQDSAYNDAFGVSGNGDWAIIVNLDKLEDYASLESCAELLAEANEGEVTFQEETGNYIVSYYNAEKDCRFYTVLCKTPEAYCRVAFYCMEADWETYGENIAQWAKTVQVN